MVLALGTAAQLVHNRLGHGVRDDDAPVRSRKLDVVRGVQEAHAVSDAPRVAQVDAWLLRHGVELAALHGQHRTRLEHTCGWVLGNGTDGNPDASRTRPRALESRTRSRTPTAGA